MLVLTRGGLLVASRGYASWVHAGRQKLTAVRHGTLIAETTPDMLNDVPPGVAASAAPESQSPKDSPSESPEEPLEFTPLRVLTVMEFERQGVRRLQRADPEFRDIIAAHECLEKLETAKKDQSVSDHLCLTSLRSSCMERQ